MDNVFEGTHTTLQRKLHRYYDKREKVSLFVHGTFGIGKTRAMELFARQKAKELDLEFSRDLKDLNDPKKFCFIALPLHQYDVGDIKGIPFPNEDRTNTVWLHPKLLPEQGSGLIFIDELNLAPPMVQSNCYQLIEDRRLGTYSIPKGYMVAGAGNLIDDRGHTFDMSMPLNNRFFHFLLRVPSVDDVEINGEVHKGWVNGFALQNDIDHRIVNYLSYQSGYLYNYDPTVMQQSPTCATPRMWEKVSIMIKGENDLREVEDFVAQGVGPAIAMEFIAWLKLSTQYDIKAIFDGKDELVIPSDPGERFSLISAIVSHYLEIVDPVKGKAVESKEADVGNKASLKLLRLALKFNREHTMMFISQTMSNDKALLKRIQHVSPETYKKFAGDIFKFVL